MNLRDQLRDLHAPVEHGGLQCDGCDFDGFESEPPQWPCRTARLVYDQAEIDDITTTFGSWSKWTREAERRKRLASGWGLADDMKQTLLRSMLRPSPIMALAHDPDLVKTSAIFPISRELADD